MIPAKTEVAITGTTHNTNITYLFGSSKSLCHYILKYPINRYAFDSHFLLPFSSAPFQSVFSFTVASSTSQAIRTTSRAILTCTTTEIPYRTSQRSMSNHASKTPSTSVACHSSYRVRGFDFICPWKQS